MKKSKCQDGKIISYEQAKEVLKPVHDTLLNLIASTGAAFELFFKEHPPYLHEFTKSTRAGMFNDMFTQGVRREMHSIPGVSIQGRGRMTYLLVGELVMLRFKKLDAQHHASNIATLIQCHDYRQLDPNLLGDDPIDATRVIFGWCMDKLNMKVLSTWLVCPSGFQHNAWAMPVELQAASAPMLRFNEAPDRARSKTTVRGRRRPQRNDSRKNAS